MDFNAIFTYEKLLWHLIESEIPVNPSRPSKAYVRRWLTNIGLDNGFLSGPR